MADGALEPEAFGRLMGEMRPRLHRYCARMVGSAIDGEDVVQDALIKAAEALPGAGVLQRPEAWLFRIAHNTALDALRRRKRQGARSEAGLDGLADAAANAEARVSAAGSFAAFLALPAPHRACVVLMDVRGHSLEETAEILGVTIPTVKAALHRGRGRLKAMAETEAAAPPRPSDADRARLRAYADLFNARDFDALRALLADDVRLDLAHRMRLAGSKDVGVYFGRYETNPNWTMQLGWAEGRPALVFHDAAEDVTYLALLEWDGERIGLIRDYRFAPYVMDGMVYGVD